jgi:hypothetical protein
MSDQTWARLGAALAEAAGRQGAPVRVWLRDDDAVDTTPALDRLAALCGAAGLPVLLAVIPVGATDALATWLLDHPFVTPCQHGFAHANHAAPGERACELGGRRSDETVMAELHRGRALLIDRLGPALSGLLVPPWNRIRDSLLPGLARAGYTALSTFAGATTPAPAPLPRLDCDLDIIDWRHGRRGRSVEDLCTRLLPLIARAGASGQPIGLLTHHLQHDEAAWLFLRAFLQATRDDPSVVFTAAVEEGARIGRRG